MVERYFSVLNIVSSIPKKSDLETHIMTHSGENKYQCDQCDRHFLRKADLETHITAHSGENKFQCVQCDRHFL